MLDVHQRTKKAVLAVEEVPLSEAHKYDVIKSKNQDQYALEVKGLLKSPKLKKLLIQSGLRTGGLLGMATVPQE